LDKASLTRHLKYVGQLTLSIVLVVVAYRMVPATEVSRALSQARPGPLVLAFLLMPFAVGMRAWRWHYILKRHGLSIPPRVVVRITFIGHAYNLLLPGSLGDIVRSYYGWRDWGNKEVMLTSSVSDKVVALQTLCLLGVPAALAVRQYELAALSGALLLVLSVFLARPEALPWSTLARLFERVTRRQLDVPLMLHGFRMDTRTFLGTVALSLVGWLVTNMMYYLTWLAFSDHVSVLMAFAVAPILNVARMLPITISGIGSVELLSASLLGSAVGRSEAVMGAVAVNLALVVAPGLIGAYWLMPGLRVLHPGRNSQ